MRITPNLTNPSRIIRFLPLVLLAMAAFNARSESVPNQGTWETTLLGRDAYGSPVPANDSDAVFLYDTTLNITWLKKGNQNGQMTWFAAMEWVSALQVGPFSGWRLPAAQIPDATCIFSNGHPAIYSQGYGVGCVGSEMGHLFNVTLNNAPGAVINTGNFHGLQQYYYWSKTPLASDPYYVWTYNLSINGQAYTGTGTNPFFTMAVRDGDVMAPVPEPTSLNLVVVGLLFITILLKLKSGLKLAINSEVHSNTSVA